MTQNTYESGAATLTVASWRRMLPDRLRDLRHDYRDCLLYVTALPDSPALMTRAAADEPATGMAMAGAIRRAINDEHADLVWAWMALAAVSAPVECDDIASIATLAVAGRLLTLATETAETDARTARCLQGLAAAWGGMVCETLGTTRIIDNLLSQGGNADEMLQAILDSTKPKPEKTRTPTPIHTGSGGHPFPRTMPTPQAVKPTRRLFDGKPTLTVVKEIALGRGASDDKALIAAWESITQPMPLAGGVDPHVLGVALEAEFPWLTEAIEAVVGDLALRRRGGTAHAHFRPLLLVGPPGTGKTHFARRVAKLLGTGFGEISAAGSSDNRLLAGTARGYSTASPSFVLQVMKQADTANPVMLVDELDKVTQDSRNGDLRTTLLPMLEALSASAWPDECLMAPADISQVNWIVTANRVEPLKGPLLTRLRIVPTTLPGPEHAEAVLAGIARDLADDLGISLHLMPDLLPETEAALKAAFRNGHSLRRIRAAYEGAVRAVGPGQAMRTTN
ncbi:AAA family ATPase [Caenispirillum bisanense]|uniref:AAA family ATPase n=1 Tax=Caenispirillum bisanense TaxID=414052 RepID=UPI0031D83BE9